jgi:hypothetical protein
MRFMAKCRYITYLGIILMLGTLSLHAQFNSGLEGTVIDSSGASVPKATLTLLNVDQGTSQKVTASDAGYYHFNSLPSGAFKLTATAEGFATVVQQGIQLEVNKITTVNVTLQVGAVTEQVTISEAPPAIQTADPGVGGFVSSKEVHELPLVGRNFIGLVSLTPGVTGLPGGGGQISAQASGDVFTGDLSISANANGLRAEQNGFTVDGGDVTSMTRGGITNFNPSADSVQEFRVTVNAFTAEYSGAGAHIDVVTKSGSNQVHGNADWFTTNQGLTARNWFQRQDVPSFQRNEFAGAIGGPIWRDRTFFFASIDKLISQVPYSAPNTVETPDFINWMKANNPNNLSTYLLSTYPSAITSFTSTQTALQVAGAGATCSTGSGTVPAGYIATSAGNVPCGLDVLGSGLLSVTTPRTGLQWGFRLDHVFNGGKDRFNTSAYRTSVQQVSGNPSVYFPAFSPQQPETTYNAHINETHTFAANKLNDMTYSFVRLDGFITCPNCFLPQVTSITGAAPITNGGPVSYIQNNFELQDHFTWDHNAHSFKFGAAWLRLQSNYFPNYSFTRPTFTFNSVYDFAADKPFSEANVYFNPITGAQTFPAVAERQPYYQFFATDTWKIKSNLTFTYGLRWETFGKVTETTEVANFVMPNTGSFADQITNTSVQIVPSILTKLRYGNLGPRLGLTWDPTKTGKLSFRSGFGKFFDAYTSQVYGGSHYDPPIAAQGTFSTVQSGPQPLFAKGNSNTFPFGIPYPTGIVLGLDHNNGLLNGTRALVQGTDPHLKTAYSLNWFGGVQWAFAKQWVAEANYIGSEGHHLYSVYDVNRFAGDLIVNNGTLKRYNQSFGAMDYAQSNLNSFYTGSSFSIKAPSFHGAAISGSYTLGKAIDQESSFGGTTGGASYPPMPDAAHPERERARADFDVRHNVSFSVVWALPGEHLTNRYARHVIGGWQLSDVTILQSGQPFSVYTTQGFIPVYTSGKITGNAGGDYNADGNNFDRPMTPSFGNVNRGSHRSDYLKGLFTATSFAAPALGQTGNLGRNTYHGPGYANSNANLAKHVPVPWFKGNKADAEFRAEAFNIFNRVNPANLVSDLNNANFGKVTSTFPSRQFQFGLRLSF